MSDPLEQPTVDTLADDIVADILAAIRQRPAVINAQDLRSMVVSRVKDYERAAAERVAGIVDERYGWSNPNLRQVVMDAMPDA